jgi:hypothetical protein
MNSHTDKTQENKSQSVANAISQQQSSSDSSLQFEDNRPEAIAQRKLQEMANNNPQVKKAAQLQAKVNSKQVRPLIADNRVVQQKPVVQFLTTVEETAKQAATRVKNNIQEIARKLGVLKINEITSKAKEFTEIANKLMYSEETYTVRCRQLNAKCDEIRNLITTAKQAFIADPANKDKWNENEEDYKFLDSWKLPNSP